VSAWPSKWSCRVARSAVRVVGEAHAALAPRFEPFGGNVELFKPGGEVRVRLVNEAYGGEGSNRDRNLFLAAVTLNGRAVTVSGLETRGSTADQPKELVGEFMLLADGNMEGVSRAPAGGWPGPETAVAQARLLPQEASDKPPVAVADLTVPEAPRAP